MNKGPKRLAGLQMRRLERDATEAVALQWQRLLDPKKSTAQRALLTHLLRANKSKCDRPKRCPWQDKHDEEIKCEVVAVLGEPGRRGTSGTQSAGHQGRLPQISTETDTLMRMPCQGELA